MSKIRNGARAQFPKDMAEHQMEVFLDDGVYRHLRFKEPGFYDQHFSIVTYPGTLVYTGDMGSFVFQRTRDMFQFFRTHAYTGDGINPDYWAEKLVAIDRAGHLKFDEEKFNRIVMEQLVDWIRNHRDQTDKDERRDLWDAVVNNVIHADGDSQGARKTIAAYDFWHKVNDDLEFTFRDLWEHNFEDYTYHYYWACYAIAWAVRQYDAAQANTGAA